MWCEVITVTANDASTTARSRTVCADLPPWHLCPTLHCHCDHHGGDDDDDGDDDDGDHDDSDDDDDSVRIFEKVFQRLFRAFVQVAECLSTEWKPQWVGTCSNLILTLSHRHRHHHSHHNHHNRDHTFFLTTLNSMPTTPASKEERIQNHKVGTRRSYEQVAPGRPSSLKKVLIQTLWAYFLRNQLVVVSSNQVHWLQVYSQQKT